MGPTRAGTQVFFNGTQVIHQRQKPSFGSLTFFFTSLFILLYLQNVAGLNATQFVSSPVAVSAWKSLSAAAVQLAIAPLTAGRLRAVGALPGALSVRLILLIELADVAAAVGQQ